MTFFRVVVLLCSVVPVRSYSTGILPPAEEACATMTPYGHHVEPQQTTSPFVIRVSDTSYYISRTLKVTLDSLCNHKFKGFLIQARRADPNLAQHDFIGSFTPIKQTRNVCGPAGNSGLTHTSNDNKTSLHFTWRAPPFLNDHIVFRATFVEDFHTYWVNVTSQIIHGNLHISVPFQAAWVTRTMYPCSMRKARFYIDPKCGESMGCFHDCSERGWCTMQVSWKREDEYTIEFTIKIVVLGNGDKWTAIGFSEDTQMGMDSVSECVEVGTSVFVYPSFNLDHSSIRISQDHLGHWPLAGSDRDGIFECTFRRNKTMPGDNRFFDLNHDFYLLVAAGRATPEGNKIQHTLRPWVSRVTIDLQRHTSTHVHTTPKMPPRMLPRSNILPKSPTLPHQRSFHAQTHATAHTTAHATAHAPPAAHSNAHPDPYPYPYPYPQTQAQHHPNTHTHTHAHHPANADHGHLFFQPHK